MEELLNQANSKYSFFGTISQITGLIGGGISVFVLLSSLENIGFSTAYAVGGLGSSAAIGAIGTTANQSKRQAELLKLLVQSTNSASELPNKWNAYYLHRMLLADLKYGAINNIYFQELFFLLVIESQ